MIENPWYGMWDKEQMDNWTTERGGAKHGDYGRNLKKRIEEMEQPCITRKATPEEIERAFNG